MLYILFGLVTVMVGLAVAGILSQFPKNTTNELKNDIVTEEEYLSSLGMEWILGKVKDAFIVANTTYQFMYGSPRAFQLYPSLKLCDKEIPLPDDVKTLFVSGNEKFKIEDYYFEKTVNPLENEQGELVGYVVLLQDVTQREYLLENLKETKLQMDKANQSKENFLVNMSHEIRTPMNVISGMTEMLLREDCTPEQKKYILGIHYSSETLLSMMEDILNFSSMKYEEPVFYRKEYDPYEILLDLSKQTLTRIGDLDIEFLLDVDENLPKVLYGDCSKWKQILDCILSNAVKYTKKGSITLSLQVVELLNDELEMHFCVKDTGVGIKPENLNRIFDAFSKAEQKKDFYKKGIGIGLSICKKLCEMMGGNIEVKSEYGKGSEFQVTLVQKIVDHEIATPKEEEKKYNIAIVCNAVLLNSLRKLCKYFQCNMYSFEGALEIKEKIDFVITDMENLKQNRDKLLSNFAQHSEICVLRNPVVDELVDETMMMVEKPVCTQNFRHMLLKTGFDLEKKKEKQKEFIAPEASILIVDDIEINLEVTQGLLLPLCLQIDTAENGKEAISKVMEKHYDLVFMDNIMPVMDGIEATKIIRGMGGEYETLPILALTADAVDGARERFLAAGMNEYIAKPVVMKDVCEALKKYVSEDKIWPRNSEKAINYLKEHEEPDFMQIFENPRKKQGVHEENVESAQLDTTVEENQNAIEVCEEAKPLDLNDENLTIEGLDVQAGIENCGSRELWLSLLGDYYKIIDLKSSKIEKFLADDLIHDYVIEVHALKNTSRLIGALQLSDMFFRMEKMGNAGNVEVLIKETPEVLALYRSYKPILKPFGAIQNEEKEETADETLINLLESVKNCFDCFDLDGVDSNMEQLENYKLPEILSDDFDMLRAYVADVAMEDAMQLTSQMIQKLY